MENQDVPNQNMAFTYCHCSAFHVISIVLWLMVAVFFRESFSEPIHLMSVTPTPYGANLAGASFSCLLSEPDTQKLDGLTIRRHVQRGSQSPYDTYDPPGGTTYNNDPALNKRTANLPTNLAAQGVFYCEASDNEGESTRVPVTIMHNNRRFEPSDGQSTITVNVNEDVTPSVDILISPLGLDPSKAIRWQRQPDETGDAMSWRPDQDPDRVVVSGSTTSFNFDSVTASDSAVYGTYWKGLRNDDFRFSLIRLIVRECQSGRWGPPSCASFCDVCYNGGICVANTGKCVCRPGFTGPNCLTACGEDSFGWSCDHQCGLGGSLESCSGSLFCMPDPVGCSCMTGWMGSECNQGCSNNMFGAGCRETCHCAGDVACDIFTGECPGDCASGWSGPGCQIPDICEAGYYGENCTGKCPNCDNCNKTTGCLYNECHTGFWGSDCNTLCHCLNGAPCDRSTGKCNADPNTRLSLCEPGYVSDAGINLENCQQYEGCFAACTKTCHCNGEVEACNSNTGVCSESDGKMCKEAWTGDSCQTGIVSLSYTKTNPGQPVNVTCIVTGDPNVPGESEVQLYYLKENIVENGILLQAIEDNNYLTVNYQANPRQGSEVTCVVNPLNAGSNSASAVAEISPLFYVLPKIFEAPSVVDVNSTSVTVVWNAWVPEVQNAGDGPVIGYQVYYKLTSNSSQMDNGFIPSTNETQTIYQGTITLLEPATEYAISVSAVREGPGGIGEPSPNVTVSTVAMTTQPPVTTPPTTAPPMPTSKGSSTQVPEKAQTTTKTTTTAAAGGSGGKQTGNIGGTVAVVVMVLLLVVIFIIVVIIFIRRRNKRKEPSHATSTRITSDADLPQVLVDGQPAMDSKANSVVNLGFDGNESTDEPDGGNQQRPKSQPPPPPTPTPLPPDSPALRKRATTSMGSSVSSATLKRRLRVAPVNINDFASYVKSKRTTSDMKIEWESLPQAVVKPTTVAKDPGNKGKNRFRNVIAYDHSRVSLEPLDNDSHSDYINACYIKGIKDRHAYIATQGPNDMTLGDFWRLVWQEEVTVIVMACNLVEEGRPKCAGYWPKVNATSESYGGISVTLTGEEEKGDTDAYIIRTFTVSKDGQEDNRKVTQLHYTKWPDKNVPKHCTPVIKFITDVKKHHTDKSPLLVHCSAGAGRTGTIIGIHAMMDLADETKQVDIYNFVFSMRKDRPHMVQTADQYIFVHDAMLEYLCCKDSYIGTGEFAARLKSLKDTNPENGKTHLEEEFEILGLISPSHGAQKTGGSLSPDGLSKIRSGESVPVDASRPYLMTSREDGDTSGYINAAFLNGYKKKDLFISTQAPMTNTVVDLWRMMYDYNCTCIVHLNDMDHEEEDCPQFWPDEGENEYGPFKVTLMDKESTQDFDVRTLELVHATTKLKAPLTVKHFQYTTWPKDDERPATSEGFIQLISAVEEWQKTREQPGPIVVLCMNAAGRTGAFCTVRTCLDQVKEEEGCDVLQNVKQLRINRTNVVDTPEKYLFCYDVIHTYLKTLNTGARPESSQNIPDIQIDNLEEPVVYDNLPATRTPNNKRKTQSQNIYDNVNGAMNKDEKSRKGSQKMSRSKGSKQAPERPKSRPPSVRRSGDTVNTHDVELNLYGNIPSVATPKVERKEGKKAANPGETSNNTLPSSKKKSRKRAENGKGPAGNPGSTGREPRQQDQIYQNTMFEGAQQDV